MHAIAGKAAGFGEALRPEFRTYMEQVGNNARILGETLIERGLNVYPVARTRTWCWLIFVQRG